MYFIFGARGVQVGKWLFTVVCMFVSGKYTLMLFNCLSG